MDNKVTVGVVYYKELKSIKGLLSSLFKETNVMFLGQFIIVINSSPTKEIIDLINLYKESFQDIKIQVIYNLNNNIGESRRIIVKKAKFEYLCITDPDCVVSSHWLSDYIGSYNKIKLTDKKIASICGAVEVKSNIKLFEYVQNNKIKLFSPQVDITNNLSVVDHSQTSNAFYDVQAVRSVGNFSLAHSKSGEDLELGMRLSYNNFSNYQIKNAKVSHHIFINEWGHFKRFVKLGVGQKNSFFGQRKIHVVLSLFFCVVLCLYYYLDTKAFLGVSLIFIALILFKFTFYTVSFSTLSLAYLLGYLISLYNYLV